MAVWAITVTTKAALAVCAGVIFLAGCAGPGAPRAPDAATSEQASTVSTAATPAMPATPPSRMDAGTSPMAARYLIHVHGPRCEH